MGGPDSYRVPGRDATAEIEVRRSRFRCAIRRVPDEPAARGVVAAVRREHPDAGHHCSAFVLGPDAAVERSSDDGEPSGTAGPPMLEALRGAAGGVGVSDAVAVVTRWFGGVLLGTGGLARAYGDAVRVALDEAGTLVCERRTELVLELAHAEAGRLESDLRSRGVTVLGVEYDVAARLRVAVPTPEVDAFADLVAGLTSGGVVPQPMGERWVDLR